MVQVATDVIHPVLVTRVDGALTGMLKMLLSFQPGLSRIICECRFDQYYIVYITYVYIYIICIYNIYIIYIK